MQKVGILLVVGALSACASQPEKIETQYVSTTTYKDYTCEQLREEAERLTARVHTLHQQLKETADKDAAQMGVGLVLFWPTLFFLEGGDGTQAQEYARLKGEREAIEKTSIQKSCGIEFSPLQPQPQSQQPET